MRLKAIIVFILFFLSGSILYAENWNKINQQNIQTAMDYVNRLNADECPMPCYSCASDASSPIYNISRTMFKIMMNSRCSTNPTWSGEISILCYSEEQSVWFSVYNPPSCTDYRWDLNYQADNALVSRHYIDQYKDNFNEETIDNTSFVIDLTTVNIPDDEYPSKALLLNVWSCGGIENGYKAVWQDLCSGQVFYTGKGICDDGIYDCVNDINYTCVSAPTPTPTSPVPTPTPIQPTPIPTSLVSTPTPPVSTPTPPQAIPTPSPTSSPPPYPGYTPAPLVVVYGTPSYSSTVVPTPDNDGTVIDSNIDDLEYNDQVPDVGQDLEEDDTWLDTIFDLFSNHPLVDVIKGSKLTTSGELCSLSVNLYGSVIEISFCNLVDYVEIFGYFVTVCASIYAYFIIFKAS